MARVRAALRRKIANQGIIRGFAFRKPSRQCSRRSRTGSLTFIKAAPLYALVGAQSIAPNAIAAVSLNLMVILMVFRLQSMAGESIRL